MFKFVWATVVALGVVLGLVAAILEIAGTGAAIQILGVACFMLFVLLILTFASPRHAGVALTVDTTLQLLNRGKTADSTAKISYVPFRSGISHQVWHASPSTIAKVTCHLQGTKVSVSDPASDGSCIVNFGSQLRLLRRYEIQRLAVYKENQFCSDSEFFYFRVQAPTIRLQLKIIFPPDSAVAAVSRSVRVGNDHLDRGPQKVENHAVTWVVWFPSIGSECWIRWSWT